MLNTKNPKSAGKVDPKKVVYFTVKANGKFYCLDKPQNSLFTIDLARIDEAEGALSQEIVSNWATSLTFCFDLSKDNEYAIFDKSRIIDGKYTDEYIELLNTCAEIIYG